MVRMASKGESPTAVVATRWFPPRHSRRICISCAARPEGEGGSGPFAHILQRARGWAFASLGQAEAAGAAMEASLAAARDEGSLYEEAVTVEAMADIVAGVFERMDASPRSVSSI